MLQIVTELDGFDARGNIKVLMATNRPDTLDPALERPGRLDRKVLSCLALVLSCLVLSCLVLSRLVLSCLVLSCLAFLPSGVLRGLRSS